MGLSFPNGKVSFSGFHIMAYYNNMFCLQTSVYIFRIQTRRIGGGEGNLSITFKANRSINLSVSHTMYLYHIFI